VGERGKEEGVGGREASPNLPGLKRLKRHKNGLSEGVEAGREKELEREREGGRGRKREEERVNVLEREKARESRTECERKGAREKARSRKRRGGALWNRILDKR